MRATGQPPDIIEQVPKDLFIGGAWRPAQEGLRFDVEDPSTGQVLCAVADATPADGLAALDAAVKAQESWAQHPPRERGEILRRAYETILGRQERLAVLMTLEMGKPVPESHTEVAYAAEFFRWFAEEGVRVDGGYAVAPSGRGRVLVMKQPVGPCLLITPWNFPMAMGTRKIGPAVAAGCTMVVKPAGQTPLSMLALAEILQEAGLPDGVLNVVTTASPGDVMEPLIRDGRARKLSFTGSTEVGRKLLAQSADQVLRVSMELGGNAPFIVFDDADLAEEFSRRLAERMGALTVGRGVDDGVQVGPLIDADGREKVATLVADAVGKGARVLVGAQGIDGPGYFYRPTVLADVPRDARMQQVEIFGPVAPVSPFATEDEAVAAANDTPYGLVAYVYTRDLARAVRVCERLEAGMVGLNQGIVSNPAAPFGGVKHSGLGREGGRVGIDEFLETKYVALNL
jgi:succinate-semialdehyde dehydrogenase/glutarate-semialdehyde dehydrogenase